jgi:D-alanyl-D-alanine carboxypeptidase/Putative peptidoglycan binding domain
MKLTSPVLQLGRYGEDVRQWQAFLSGMGYVLGACDGSYGPKTYRATVIFQQGHALRASGLVDESTWQKAIALGFKDDRMLSNDRRQLKGLPALPNSLCALQYKTRDRIFPEFHYHRIQAGSPFINISDHWKRANLKTVYVPQLKNIRNPPSNCRITFNIKTANQLQALWEAWEKAGMLKCIITWDGSFASRTQRGNSNVVSNHAYGLAFDINSRWNGFKAFPALRRTYGSVCDLVPLANEYGFFWGGHFKRHYDGMHFEVARILNDEDLIAKGFTGHKDRS